MTDARYPLGKSFAFTVVDDTDGSTVANVKPVYELLQELGFRTTKTVWTQRSRDPDQFGAGSETLEDPGYRDFVLELFRRGFEIAMHTAAPGSSSRPETIAAYETFKTAFGAYPRMNLNHSLNLENIYWGRDRMDGRVLKALYSRFTPWNGFSGHVEGSEYFWGDVCRERTRYVRNFTFRCLNTLKADPGMPYHDPRRPYVNFWFSSSDGADAARFSALISERNQERLVAEAGACIMYTHFAKGFLEQGRLNETWERRMRSLARKNGWFVPASDLLDHLLSRKRSAEITASERRKLSRRWMIEKLWEKAARRFRPGRKR